MRIDVKNQILFYSITKKKNIVNSGYFCIVGIVSQTIAFDCFVSKLVKCAQKPIEEVCHFFLLFILKMTDFRHLWVEKHKAF